MSRHMGDQLANALASLGRRDRQRLRRVLGSSIRQGNDALDRLFTGLLYELAIDDAQEAATIAAAEAALAAERDEAIREAFGGTVPPLPTPGAKEISDVD